MSRLLLKVVVAVPVIAASLWPLAAFAYGDVGTATPSPGRFKLLLAYVDPGAAGFVIVTVLGFISAVGYMARSYLARLKTVVFRAITASREGKDGEER